VVQQEPDRILPAGRKFIFKEFFQQQKKRRCKAYRKGLQQEFPDVAHG